MIKYEIREIEGTYWVGFWDGSEWTDSDPLGFETIQEAETFLKEIQEQIDNL